MKKQKEKGSATARQTRQRGFTLLELLVVLAIIGLLAGIIMLALNSARNKARDAKRAGDMRQMITALEQYYSQRSSYPTGTASIAAGGALLSDSNSFNGGSEPFVPNYIPLLPAAPKPNDGGCGSSSGAGNNNYWYETTDDGMRYTMTFCLGNDAGDWLAGSRTVTPEGVF
jgi:prepilin-type N-terminal cleavage/methylation domain-containing protein